MVLSTTLQHSGKWMMQATLPVEKGLDYMGFNSNKILEANNLSNTYQWKGDCSLADFYWKQGGQQNRQTQDTPSNISQVNTVL